MYNPEDHELASISLHKLREKCPKDSIGEIMKRRRRLKSRGYRKKTIERKQREKDIEYLSIINNILAKLKVLENDIRCLKYDNAELISNYVDILGE